MSRRVAQANGVFGPVWHRLGRSAALHDGVVSPAGEEVAGEGQAVEDCLNETLVAEAAIQVFHEAVLLWLAR